MGGSERGDNFHLLATRAAKRRICKVHLGNQPSPVPPPKLHELRLLVVYDNDILRRLRCLVVLDPPELSTYRRRDRAVGVNRDLVSESYVRHEHGEKLERCDELVITSESRTDTLVHNNTDRSQILPPGLASQQVRNKERNTVSCFPTRIFRFFHQDVACLTLTDGRRPTKSTRKPQNGSVFALTYSVRWDCCRR